MSETLKAKAERLHALHLAPELLVLPNAWDCASAMLFEQAGFPAIATTSAGIAFCRGYRDGEQISRDEMLDEVARIAARVDVPVTADLEAGYGVRPEDVAETVRLAIEAGLVGCNIEDGTVDRGETPLLDFELSVERIRAAREAADTADIPFVINARTDGFLRIGAGGGVLDDALRRANAYYEAGARSLFVPQVADGQTIGRLARAIAGPINILAGPKTPSVAELEALGVARLTIGSGIARAAYTITRAAAEELSHSGTFGFTENTVSHTEMNALLDRDAPRGE